MIYGVECLPEIAKYSYSMFFFVERIRDEVLKVNKWVYSRVPRPKPKLAWTKNFIIFEEVS